MYYLLHLKYYFKKIEKSGMFKISSHSYYSKIIFSIQRQKIKSETF